jgi:four helix bundle protein
MKNYRELKVWQKGMELVKEVYRIAPQLPKEELFGLRSQMTRTAVSSPSNIAEGSSRQSEKEYGRFLEIALGSCFGLETQVLILEQTSILRTEQTAFLLQLIQEVQMMLQAFIRKLDTK